MYSFLSKLDDVPKRDLEISKMYLDGASIKSIMKKFNLSQSSVYRLAKKAGEAVNFNHNRREAEKKHYREQKEFAIKRMATQPIEVWIKDPAVKFFMKDAVRAGVKFYGWNDPVYNEKEEVLV